MNARVRFVLAVAGSLSVAHAVAAQDASESPSSPPPPSAPADATPAPAGPPPAPTDAPPEPPPPAAPPAPAPSTAAFPTDTPPPVLAPLPNESAPESPPRRQAPAAASPPSEAPPPRAASSLPPQSPKQDDKSSDENTEISQDGLFGPFRIGVLFGAGLPSFFAFSGEIRLTRYFGAGVRFGFIPDMHFSYYGEASVSYQDYGLYAHLHPFGGGFLLGAEVGYAHADGSYSASYDLAALGASGIPGAPSSVIMKTSGSVQTLILTPEIGYVYTWRAGFTFGFDVGAQIPIAPSSVSLHDSVEAGGIPQSLLDGALDSDRKKVHDTLAKVGQTVLPAFHLRLGWLL